MELHLDSGGVRLAATLANSSAAAGPTRALVVCHGLPASAHVPSPHHDASFTELAASLSAASGWTVLTFDFRAANRGGGQPSMHDWLGDLRTAFLHVNSVDGVTGVWLAGFGAAGALCLCFAGADERIRGVATFGAPAEFDETFAAPSDPSALWPLQSISKIPPRPVLLVHGDADDVTPVADTRALADAAGGDVELRILAGAGHALRHDPRATAVLEGWLDRQPG